jgi:3-phenylpropionate/trans-cinnamate dioxygenase ferredoxin reductase subunit
MSASDEARTDEVDLLVVGGGPGGLAAVTAYRDAGGTGVVVLATAEADPPYDRTALSKTFLRGADEPAALALESAEFYRDREIDLRTGTTAVALDTGERVVGFDDGTSCRYRRLVLATGSEPAALPVPGAEHSSVFRLRSFESGRLLRAAAVTPGRAVVTGSGFIACEVAASLAAAGWCVTIVTDEVAPHSARLGTDAAERIAGWLRSDGIELALGSPVVGFAPGRVVLENAELHARLVLMAAGIEPRIALAESAGLTIEDGRVVVDAQMRTSVPSVFAVGDIALAYNTAAGRRLAVEHWGDAEAMGTVAGTCAAGGTAGWDAVPGFWSDIGGRTLKYAAWGDGFDDAVFVEGSDGSFVVWYVRDGRYVGVLTYTDDDAYDTGMKLIEAHERFDPPGGSPE